MRVIKAEQTIFCDVDETLVMHDSEGLEVILVEDPISHKRIELGINKPMVRLLKEESHRGSFIVVWSRGGNTWAESVVRALGIESYVDMVMTKPLVYFDDKDVADWLKYRVYLEPSTNYKKVT